MGSTQPMWVGLDLCDGLDCVEFFLTHHMVGWAGLRGFFYPTHHAFFNPTRPMHTPNNIEWAFNEIKT